MYFTKNKYLLFFIVSFFFALNISYSQDGLRVESGAALNVKNGASLFVIGDITLSNNSTLLNSGTITVFKPNSLTANFTDSNTSLYNYGIGKFVFTGTGTQTISSLNQFEQIEVDNNLNLASNIKSNIWYLNTGKVNTGLYNAIITSTSSAAVIADPANINFANSWINGNLQRFISPATVNNYQFPVGDASKVNLLEMDNLSATPLAGVNYVTASFGPKPGSDAGLNVSEIGTAYSSVNDGGVWYLTPDANPASGKYDLKLYFNGFTGLADNSFGILRRPDASTTAAEWQVPAGSVLPAAGTPGRIVADGYAKRNDIATFSQLGIGMTFGPLPLQLLNFNAVKKDKAVLLQWSTANEVNTSHFEIYRGLQPASLQYMNKVPASGVLANSNYYFTDDKPLQGLSFYQLKMLDKNNSYKLSPIAKVSFDYTSMLAVYPNPVTGNTLLVDFSGVKIIKQVKLVAADGKQTACSFTLQTNNQLKVLLPTVIAKGAYALQLTTSTGEIINTKILIQ